MKRESSRPGFLKSIAWNYVGLAYEGIVGLVLIGYVVRRISSPEYGLLLLSISLCSLMFLLDFGLGNLLVQGYVQADKLGRSRLRSLISTSFMTLGGIGVLTATAMAALTTLLPGPLNIPLELMHEAVQVFILIGISTGLAFPAMALEHAYMAFHRFDRVSQLQFITTTVRLVLTVLLLAAGHGLLALAAVQVVTSALRLAALALMLPWSVRDLRLDLRGFEWRTIRPLLALGGWSTLDNTVRQLARTANSFALGSFAPMSAVAVFGIGSKLPTQLSALASKGAVVTLPSLAAHHADDDLPSLRNMFIHTQRLVFTGTLPFAVLGVLCARPLIHLWAGSAYLDAALVMQWLLVAAFSLALEYAADHMLYACGQVKKAALIAAAESVAEVLVSVSLLIKYGAAGLAAGSAITHLVIGLFWYLPAACEATGIRLSELASAVIAGQGRLVALLAAEAALLGAVLPSLSPAFSVLAAISAGAAYALVWGVMTVLPMARLRQDVLK